ncbi:MAG: PAS domain-containing sensor histidine kinase [Pseudomonadota bacterium]|nr:PAS domain-containing sensor histidine kinase [Pseudomonadota bacterium]
MPAAIVLAILLAWHKISLTTAGVLFLGVIIFTAIVTTSVFKELENFISYLKNLAQGIDIEPPHFKKGVFSSFRLADTFQTVKNIWSNQTLSDTTILENLPDPLVMINVDAEIVFMNQIAQTRFGKGLMKQHIHTLFTDEKILMAIQNILYDQARTEWFEWEYGSHAFQVRIDRLPALTRNGAIAVMTMNDITPFKRFRQQQVDFFANASHELKTPLSIISGLIETLQGPAQDDPTAQKQFLGIMGEQTEKMTNLVQKLLKLAKTQALPEIGHKEMLDICKIIKKVIADLKNKASQNGQKMRFQSEPNIPKLLGNTAEWEHVFQNLIDNAIKYGDSHSLITIDVRKINHLPHATDRGKSYLKIDVHNFGPPIESKDLDRLFDRFYRVDSVASKRVEGTGLGLSIVQQIVHDYNGTIDVFSTRQGGTTFSIHLPLE